MYTSANLVTSIRSGFNRSFTGNANLPLVVNGQKIWFRGKRVLDAVLEHLRAEYGLGDATEVLFSGGSAGGLACFLHADYVRAQFAATVKFKAAPVSGYFLNHATVDGAVSSIQSTMQWLLPAMNSSGAAHPACIAAAQPESRWRCLFANETYARATTPIFPLNSAIDKYQVQSIFDFDKGCASGQFESCSYAQIAQLNQWEKDFMRDLQDNAGYTKKGNGGFIESCLEHVAAQYSGTVNKYAVGGVTMMQGLIAWWNDPVDSPSYERLHWHLYESNLF